MERPLIETRIEVIAGSDASGNVAQSEVEPAKTVEPTTRAEPARMEAPPMAEPLRPAAVPELVPALPTRRRISLRAVLHAAREVIVRGYALALLIAVLVPGYWAVMYLFRTVFVASPVPKHLLDWQARVDVGALRAKDVPGITGPAARAPLAHYHRLDGWFQSDPQNGCTVAGCHEPLPHKTKMKVPAFANFHTTFLACEMCHVAPKSSDDVGWVSTARASAQGAPPMLRLASYLESSRKERKEDPAAAHRVIVGLLTDAVAAAGGDASLSELLLQFQTSEPGSPMWRQAEFRLVAEVPLEARGEYGAKLSRNAQEYAGNSRSVRDLAERYLAEPGSSPRRDELQKAIHSPLTKTPSTCTSCHSSGSSQLQFEKLGYSRSRSQMLTQLELASEMQNLRNGNDFRIPDITEEEDER